MKQVATLIGCLMAGLIFGSSACAYTLNGFLRRLNNDLAAPTYEATFTITDFSLGTPVDDAELTIVSPTGIRFEEPLPAFDFVFGSFTDVALTDVDTLVAGVWTIEEVKGGATHRYEFTIPPLATSNIWKPTPRIVSPLDDSTVGPAFSVVTSPGEQHGFIYSLTGLDSDAGERVEISYTGGGVHEFSFTHIPGFQTAEFESLRAFAQTSMPMTVVGVTPGANSTFMSRLFVETASPPIAFTVAIPEPGTSVLTACGLLVALGYRKLSRAGRLT